LRGLVLVLEHGGVRDAYLAEGQSELALPRPRIDLHGPIGTLFGGLGVSLGGKLGREKRVRIVGPSAWSPQNELSARTIVHMAARPSGSFR
jgi:hypothetical protein